MSRPRQSSVNATHGVDFYLDIVSDQEVPESNSCPSCGSQPGSHLLVCDGQTWYDPVESEPLTELESGMVLDVTSFCDTCYGAFDFPASGSDADALDSLVDGETVSLEVSET